MSVHLKPLFYEKAYIGKLLKFSKKRYVWRFELDGKEHEVVLLLSFFSHKESIKVDGRLKYENQFRYSPTTEEHLEIDSHRLRVISSGLKKYDLHIYHISFRDVFKPKRTKTGFELQATESITVNLPVETKAKGSLRGRSDSDSSNCSKKKRKALVVQRKDFDSDSSSSSMEKAPKISQPKISPPKISQSIISPPKISQPIISRPKISLARQMLGSSSSSRSSSSSSR